MTPDLDLGVRPTSPLATSTVATGAAVDSTVVIVDDQPANVALLERLLDIANVGRVHGFTDPRQALAHCTDALPDLIMLDLHMPDIDGFAFMEAVQNLVPEGTLLPVVILTADIATEVKQRALRTGAKDFLTKPFDATEVLLRVANLLETKALHGRLERHNEQLRATLEARTASEREAAAEHERRRSRIDRALAPGGLAVVFQPIADLGTGNIVGAEALARFAGEPHRPPNEWFAEAADIGRGPELELVAIDRALEQLHRVRPDAFLAVNASPATAVTPELAALLARHPAERTVLELTEHSRVDDYDPLISALESLRQQGVRIAVDDTGSGYASLQHLLRIRPDIVKLDSTLTRGIDADPVRRSLAAALITFTTEMGATVIAEGIEAASELTTLQRIGIPWGQGYHLARPAPLPIPAAVRLPRPGA